MARNKQNQNQEEDIENKDAPEESHEDHHSESTIATAEPPVPMVESTVEGGAPETRVYPQIRAGTCEFHGVPYGTIDYGSMKGRCWHVCKNDPLCPHSKTGCETDEKGMRYHSWVGYCRHEHNYKGMQIKCSYCPIDTDFRAIAKIRTFNIYQHPENRSVLIICCSDFRCERKHQSRFIKNQV